ncbi:MAG: hypothetical protein ABI609_00580 [Acidobacteriota bacterium]
MNDDEFEDSDSSNQWLLAAFLGFLTAIVAFGFAFIAFGFGEGDERPMLYLFPLAALAASVVLSGWVAAAAAWFQWSAIWFCLIGVARRKVSPWWLAVLGSGYWLLATLSRRLH